jgi:DNA-binding transcriptional regulator YdaS (Cro superfamily)
MRRLDSEMVGFTRSFACALEFTDLGGSDYDVQHGWFLQCSQNDYRNGLRMTTPHAEIAELIDRAAKVAGSQNKAAQMAGINQQNLSHYRTGLREMPPEAAAALAHVAGLDATEWLARATLWRSVGKPYEGVLKQALGGALRVTGGALASFLAAVVMWPGDVARCIKR